MTSRLLWESDALGAGARIVPVVLVAGVPVVLTPAGVRPTTVSASTPDDLWWPGAGALTETLPSGATFDPVKDLLDPGETWETFERADVLDGGVTVEAFTFSVLDPGGAATALLSARDALPSTLLAGDVTPASTTISVVSTLPFEASGIAAIGAEVFTYTAKTSTQLTGCVRGRFGSRARGHRAAVAHRPLVVGGGPRHWQGRLASVWLCGLSADGSTLIRPTLIYLGVVGAGVQLTRAMARWSVPLDHVTTALSRKVATQGVELYGVAHFNSDAAGHPLNIVFAREVSGVHVVVDASLRAEADYPHDGGWHPSWPNFAEAAGVFAASTGPVFVRHVEGETSVNFDGSSATPIDATVEVPWASVPVWSRGDIESWQGPVFGDTPGAFLHLEGRLKLGSSDDFAKIPVVLQHATTTSDGEFGVARVALVADTDETDGCTAGVQSYDAATQTVVVSASLPSRTTMSPAEVYAATRVTSRTSARLGVLATGGSPVAALRATALMLVEMFGSDVHDTAVDWDDLSRAMSSAPSAIPSAREYRFSGGDDSLLSVLRDECRLRGMVLTIRHGRITARRLQSFADVESTVATITETDTIAEDGVEIPAEVIDSTEPLATTVEFLVAVGSGRVRTVSVTDTTFHAEFGDGEVIKVGALQWLPTSAPLPDISPALVDVAQQILGPAAEPSRIVRITATPRLMGLQSGDLVALNHSRIPTWTGARGLTNAVCQVLEMRRSLFGGRLRATIALRLGSGDRVGYAPSVLVAAGGLSGTTLTVDTASAWGPTCFASDTTASGEPSVNACDGFAVGDRVTLHQLGTRTPIASESFTLTGVFAAALTFDAAPSAAMIAAASAQYSVMVTLDAHAVQSATNRARWAFVSDDTTGAFSTGANGHRWGA